jgi:hypothetical protein
MFLHFYGNHARHRIPPGEAGNVLAKWDRAIRRGEPLPRDFARFHWCCIQNKHPGSPISGGDLPRYHYRPEDIAERHPTG